MNPDAGKDTFGGPFCTNFTFDEGRIEENILLGLSIRVRKKQGMGNLCRGG